MRNLVWTFWFALILAIIGTFLTSVFLVKQWNSFLSYSQIENRQNYPLQTLSKKIQILEHIILPHSISHAGYLIRGNLRKVIS